MVKIERPHSLFGKYPYVVEQGLLYSFVRDVNRGFVFVRPRLVTLPPFIAEFPIEVFREHTPKERRERGEFFLGRAKRKLEEIGV